MKKNTEKRGGEQPSVKPPDEPMLEGDIQRRAYELWEADGRPHGSDMAHWLEAERQIKGRQENVG